MACRSDLEVPRFSECQSYKTFTKELDDRRGNSKKVNDLVSAVPKDKELDKDASSQVLRGSFVEVVATWEKYVQCILKEAVETVFTSVYETDSAQSALASASSRELFSRAMVFNVLSDSAKRRESSDEKPKKKIANLTKRERSTVELCVSVIAQPGRWRELMDTFKEDQLNRCDRVTPLLFGEDGIDSKFKSIFDTPRCLSDIIIEMGPVKLSFRVKGHNHSLEITTSQALNDVLRLYYGARCAFSHGQTDRTFQSGGALHDFPTKYEFQQQVGEVPGNYLYILYSYVKDYGNEAWIHYTTLINLQRYVRTIAFRLFAAISKWVYDEFQICIWNFDPDKDETQDASVNDDTLYDLPSTTSTSNDAPPLSHSQSDNKLYGNTENTPKLSAHLRRQSTNN